MRPAGKVSEVFTTPADAEGAYRWLENPAVQVDALVAGVGRSCAMRCAKHAFVYVPVDGSSVSLVDLARTKDFGALGAGHKAGRGVKVLGAIAVSPEGVSLGVCALEWWSRPLRTKAKKQSPSRPTKEKETQHWLDAVTQACRHFAACAPQTRCWFQLDREADSWSVLHHLAATPHWFTVRASRDRRLVQSTPCKPKYLRKKLARAPQMGEMDSTPATGRGREDVAFGRTSERRPFTWSCATRGSAGASSSLMAVWQRRARNDPTRRETARLAVVDQPPGGHCRGRAPCCSGLRPALAHRGLSQDLEERGQWSSPCSP